MDASRLLAALLCRSVFVAFRVANAGIRVVPTVVVIMRKNSSSATLTAPDCELGFREGRRGNDHCEEEYNDTVWRSEQAQV